jgi:small subunit ribosomal protein S16
MVRIRLRRTGLKGQPTYRIIAAEKESPRDGRFIEILGFYNPRTEPFTFDVQEAKVYDWLSKGAQPSESAMQLFKSVGLMDRYARLKNGEPVDTLVAEAKAHYASRVTNPKTTEAAKG